MYKTINKYNVLWVCTGLVVITLIVFWQVRTFEFVNYDDPDYVSENRHVRAGLNAGGIKWAFTTNHADNWHPLTWLSHMLDCELFGIKPGPHHLINLIFHIVNTLLLFAVLKAMTGSLWACSFVAALFAIHPLHVESVAWISERKDVLSTFFWILTMWAYVLFVRKSRVIWYLATLTLFTLGLLVKPMLVTLPFVLLLLDYWPLGRFETDRRIVQRLVVEKIPYFIISAIICVITLSIEAKGAGASLDLIGLKTRILNTPIAYMTYIVKMIWPSSLAALYPHPGEGLSIVKAAIATALLLGISVVVIRFACERKYLPTGWFWFLGTLVPVIGLVQVGPQGWADRYSYVPLTGLFVVVAWGMPELLSKWRYREIFLVVSSIAVILVLSVCSRLQTRYWQNSETICRRALKVTRNNSIMHNNFGVVLQSQGGFDEAIDHFRRALKIRPDDTEAHNNIGNVLQKQGKLDEAIIHYLEALRIMPNDAKTYSNLGIALATQGKLDEAIRHFRRGLEIQPDNVEILNNLAIAHKSQGNFNDAISCYTRILESKPDDTKIHYKLGNMYQSQGKVEDAIRHFRRVVQIEPDNAEAHYELAGLLQSLGKLNEAIISYRKVVEIVPEWPVGLNSLAWLFATDPNVSDASEAIELAERAAELTRYQDAYILDTLAGAYAASGRYDEAIKTEETALKLALAGKNEELSNHIRRQLELYRHVKP
jgi:tetratricopeptide (TPR) repeat protein